MSRGANMQQTVLAIIMFQALLVLPLPAEERSPEDQELIKQLDISNIDVMHGLTFEIYVCKLLENQGYVAQNMRASNDFGTDIIATKGDDKFSIQVKRSKNPIDRKAISDAVAGMKYYKCNRSMAVSNNVFTKQAKKFAKETGCALIGREELIKWITAYRQTAKNKND
jgi:HJR/Mrr/RecB family endonuclease